MLRPTVLRSSCALSAEKHDGRPSLRLRTLVLFTTILALLSLYSFGQVTSGSMYGEIQDPSGAVVPGATVTVHSDATGVNRVVTSKDSGEFVVTNLPPGTYAVTVESKGFQTLRKEGVVLSAGDRLNAGQFSLGVSATEGEVTVNADTAELQLQSNSGERSDVITSKQLNDVALNGRNVLDYMKLIPGVTGLFDGHLSGTGGLDSFNINGSRANEHEMTIDGASNVDTGNNGGTHITMNPDAIEEVKVLTSNYQAEYGKAAGGQIALTTKAGTNDWHGNGRFFHRNDGLNANEWFNKKSQTHPSDSTVAPTNEPYKYRYNYAGYSIGGPIVKNKLFFFWNQEYYRQLVPISGTFQFYTPTALERQGDFSQSVIPDPNGNGSIPVQIAGPGIVNNKIDPSLLSPAQQAVYQNMVKLLSLYPLPNVSGFGLNGQNYNYSSAFSAHNPRREDIVRVDYQLNNANRLYGRYVHNSETDTAPYTPFPGPFGIFACASPITFTGGCTQQHPGWNVSVNLVSTITPTLLNELSVGPSHTLSIASGANGNTSLSANGVSLPLLYPTDTIPDLSFGGLQNVNFQGPYLGATPWRQANTTINANDNLTWSHGNHTIKGGVFYQRSRKDQIAWGNANGQFSFGTGPTSPAACSGACGDPLASALLGDYNSFDQSTARPLGKFRYNQLEFYVQDTWKLTHNFTLDYGMRFAWIPPQYDANNQIALFNPQAYNPATAVAVDDTGNVVAGSGNPLDGMQYTKDGTIPDGGWNSRGIMPEPRLGFAWDLFDDHKTILRGGGGMMHDRTQGNLIFNTVFNNPALVQTANLSAGNISDLGNQSASFGTGTLSNIVGAARDGKVPTVYSFSLGIQHEIGAGATLDIAYVGSLSRHLTTARDINAIPYGTAFTRAAQDPANFPGGVVPAVEPNLPAAYAAAGYDFSGLYAYGRPSYTDAPLVPYKGYGQIQYLEWNGTSNYNSLQVSVQKRFGKGLTAGAVYTWSKSLTTASSDQDLQDPFNPLLDYRAADWDRTHVFAANYVYDIPGLTKHFNGPRWLSYITDNYQLSGVTNFMTGTPFNTSNNFGYEPGTFTGGNMYGAIPYYNSVDQQGNPILPSIGPPGRATRDILRNGGMQNWDMSIFKNIPFGHSERYSIQLRLEAFNAFNHPNFNDKNYPISVNGPYQYSPTDPFSISKGSNWGTYSDTYGTGPGGFRVIQLGAKLYF